MARVDQRPAQLDICGVVGDDLTVTFTVTENGSPWDSTGATITTGILSLAGVEQVTDFTTVASSGSLTLSLTDTNTTTLGAGTFQWYVSVTKSGTTRTWVAGKFQLVAAGTPGVSSSSSATLSITTGDVALSYTSLVAPAAANITVTDAGGFYTATNVEAALAEVFETPSTTTRRVVELATDAEAIALADTERAVTPANLAAYRTLLDGRYLQPADGVARTVDARYATSLAAFGSSNRTTYVRAEGFATNVSSIVIYVGTSSGNISVAVYGNNDSEGTAARPSGARKATSGAIACPTGSAFTAVSITPTISIAAGDWIAISADNTTATFARSALTFSGGGISYVENSAHPAPASVGSLIAAGSALFASTS